MKENVNFTDAVQEKSQVTVIYANDPLCCFCWAFEPVIRKFRTLYKDKITFINLMGGMVETWESFDGGSVMNPQDVKPVWVQQRSFGMPIDGSIWDNEAPTSIPSSTAIKLVEEISETSALRILRMVREELLAFNRNISKDSVLEDILNRQNRNGEKIVADIKGEHAKSLMKEDMDMCRKLGVSAFPTVIILNEEGNGVRLTGLKTFDELENALKEVAGEIEPNPLPELASMFDYSRNIFFKEIEVMYDLEPEMVEDFIKKNLPENSYEIREVVNSKFIIRK